MQTVDRLMGRGVIDDQLYEELEEALLQADAHVQVSHAILDELRKAVREEKITTADGIKQRLQKSIARPIHANRHFRFGCCSFGSDSLSICRRKWRRQDYDHCENSQQPAETR